MPFTISNFREKVIKDGGGFARPNLFQVSITAAPISTDVASAFEFECKIASIPTSTIGVIEVPYFGRQVKVPGNRTFDNLSLTVINDENFSVRNAIEGWMATLNSHSTNVSAVFGDDLRGQVVVKHYGTSGPTSNLGEWKFEGCFPVALGEIGLDWGSNDTAEEYTIDWAYDYWTHVNEGGLAP